MAYLEFRVSVPVIKVITNTHFYKPVLADQPYTKTGRGLNMALGSLSRWVTAEVGCVGPFRMHPGNGLLLSAEGDWSMRVPFRWEVERIKQHEIPQGESEGLHVLLLS